MGGKRMNERGLLSPLSQIGPLIGFKPPHQFGAKPAPFPLSTGMRREAIMVAVVLVLFVLGRNDRAILESRTRVMKKTLVQKNAWDSTKENLGMIRMVRLCRICTRSKSRWWRKQSWARHVGGSVFAPKSSHRILRTRTPDPPLPSVASSVHTPTLV